MDQFDVVVIGGGSAGSAAAARLAADGKLRVCLLEAGGANTGLPIRTPGLLSFAPESSNWAYDTEPMEGLNGRTGYQPRGRGMGGSSAINGMVYIRGHARDYDHWRQLGLEGWSYADVLPYFKRSETNENGASDFHGADGPLHVSNGRSHLPLFKAFIEAGASAVIASPAPLPDRSAEQFFAAVRRRVHAGEPVAVAVQRERAGSAWAADVLVFR